MKTVNSALKEATDRKTRSKNGRALSDDEVRLRCDRILDFCKKSKEEGGYGSAASKGQMIAKVTDILNALATDAALACNKEMAGLQKKQDHMISTMQGMLNTMKGNNDQLANPVEEQNTGMVAHQAVQESLAGCSIQNLEVVQAEEACGKKRKYKELEEQCAQAKADRDTWREVAHASQTASSSQPTLEQMMGDQLATELVELKGEVVELKGEVEFWKEVADAPSKEPGDAASEYDQSECEKWFNTASDEGVEG